MDDTEHGHEESASLKGKGWEILVGGRENPFALGGQDPFDQGVRNPFSDDDEADAILRMGSVSAAPPAVEEGEVLPPDAFWDRGRGAMPEPSLASEQPVEPPPRDLSPEDLAYIPEIGELLPEPSAAEPGRVPPDLAYKAEEPTEARGVAMPGVEVEVVETKPELPGEFAPVQPEPVETGGPVAPPEDLPLPTETPIPATPPWPLPKTKPYSAYDPFEPEVIKPRPTEAELPPDEELEKKLITTKRINALWDEIDETYDLVINDVRGYYSATEEAIADLKKARELLLAGPEHFDNAEVLVKKVKARLRLEEKVRQWSRTRGVWLAVYLVVWLLVLSASSVFTIRLQEFVNPLVPDWMASTILPALFGALGGVVGALWVLIQHIAKKRDFDPIHTPWYVANPFMGAALGVVTYIIVRVGGGQLTNLLSNGADQIDLSKTSPVLYALCIVVGFKQNLFWELVERFVKAILPKREEEEEAKPEGAAEAAAQPPVSGPQG